MTTPADTSTCEYYLVDLGNQIKSRRKKLNMSIRYCAESVNMSYAYLSNIENGKANPTLRELHSIANGLGMNLHVELRSPLNDD